LNLEVAKCRDERYQNHVRFTCEGETEAEAETAEDVAEDPTESSSNRVVGRGHHDNNTLIPLDMADIRKIARGNMVAEYRFWPGQ
jgi:hypothetical protein